MCLMPIDDISFIIYTTYMDRRNIIGTNRIPISLRVDTGERNARYEY